MNNQIEYNDLADNAMRAGAITLVHKCGIRADLKGSESLVDAILLFAADRRLGFCEIYRTIAERHGLRPKSVLREINYALPASEDLNIRLSDLTGIRFNDTDVHASRVIAYLARLLDVPELAAI